MTTDTDTNVDTDEPDIDFVDRDLIDVPFDERGHRQITRRHLGRVYQTGLVTEGEPVEWMDRVSILGGANSCRTCDASPGYRVIEDRTGQPERLRAVTACALPNGVEMVNDLAVPSGRIIMVDSLNPIFWPEDLDRDDEPGYASLAGQAAFAKRMFDLGCAFGWVGNSSPSLIRTGEDRYVITTVDTEVEPGEPGHTDGEVLGSICTDLHAYSIADYDDWLTKVRAWLAQPERLDADDWDRLGLVEWVAAGEHVEDLPWHVNVVDLSPGTYRFTHHTSEASFDGDDWPVVYADIERVG